MLVQLTSNEGPHPFPKGNDNKNILMTFTNILQDHSSVLISTQFLCEWNTILSNEGLNAYVIKKYM